MSSPRSSSSTWPAVSAASTSTYRARRRRRAVFAWLGSHIVLIVACAVVIAPIYFLVLGSFKSVEEFFAAPFGLPAHFGLGVLELHSAPSLSDGSSD